WCEREGLKAEVVAEGKNGTIHMGLSREVEKGYRLIRVEQAPHQGVIADVSLYEDVPRIIHDRSQRVKIAGVGQPIEVDHTVALRGDELPHEAPDNKTCPTCRQYRLHPNAFDLL